MEQQTAVPAKEEKVDETHNLNNVSASLATALRTEGQNVVVIDCETDTVQVGQRQDWESAKPKNVQVFSQ